MECPEFTLTKRCSLGSACPWTHALVGALPVSLASPALIAKPFFGLMGIPRACSTPENILLGAPARAAARGGGGARRGHGRRGRGRGAGRLNHDYNRQKPWRQAPFPRSATLSAVRPAEGEHKSHHSQPMTVLRAFHNLIKRNLLDTYAVSGGNLLDLASGKGGDLKKFLHLNLRHVWCSDVSAEHVRLARERMQTDNSLKQWGAAQRVHFSVVDLNTADDSHSFWAQILVNTVDTTSCFFALHYFARTTEQLSALLRRIAARLKPGGYFLGCLPDGNFIASKTDVELKTEFMTIVRSKRSEDESINQSLVMTMDHSIIEGGSEEYLVTREMLKAAASTSGLVVESIDNFANWLAILSVDEHADVTGALKANLELTNTSFVNMSFVLRKPLSVAGEASLPFF